MAEAPPRPRITFEQVLVGRKEAEKLLGSNVRNRNIRDGRVRNYAVDMLSEDWLEAGETVKFDTNNEITDGQHRLLGLLLATGKEKIRLGGREYEPNPDLKVWLTIVRGLDPKSQRAVDIGASRSLADTLHLEYGEQNAMMLAAIIRIVQSWEAGYRRQIAKRELATNATILAFFEKNKDVVRQLAVQVKQEIKHIPLAPSVLALCHYILEERDPGDAEVFFTRLADGQGLFKGDPIYELRERLKALRDEHGAGSHRLTAYTLALVIKAWNAYRNNEKINILSFKMGGAHPESFPEPM